MSAPTVDLTTAAERLGLTIEPEVDLLPAYRDAVAQRWADGLLTDAAAILAMRAADHADEVGVVTELKWTQAYALADMTVREGDNARRVLLALGLLCRGSDGEWMLCDPRDFHNDFERMVSKDDA